MSGHLPQEQHSGLVVAKYTPEIAFKIVVGVADGDKSMKELCAEAGIGRATFYRWLTMYGDLRTAYNAAREVSASEFEDKALALANKLAEPGKQWNATQISAYRAAMEQYRWSATHRDPATYGQHNLIQLAVPVTITTNLDLGDGVTPTMPVVTTSDNIYNITALVPEDASTATVSTDDPLDVTEPGEPLVPQKKPGRRAKPDPRESAVAKRRAGIYAARDARRAAKLAAKEGK